MESVEQQEDGADTDHSAQNQRVPPLSQIYFLDEAVDSWETVGQSGDFGLNGLEHPSLKRHVLFGRHGNAYCIVNKPIRVPEVFVLLQEKLGSSVVDSGAAFVRLNVSVNRAQQVLSFSEAEEVGLCFMKLICVVL